MVGPQSLGGAAAAVDCFGIDFALLVAVAGAGVEAALPLAAIDSELDVVGASPGVASVADVEAAALAVFLSCAEGTDAAPADVDNAGVRFVRALSCCDSCVAGSP